MSSEITFTVEGLGTFQAHPRTMGAELSIARDYAKLIGGPEEGAPENLRILASIQSQLSTILSKVPDDFDLNTALVSDCYAIFAALRSAEDRFHEELARKRQAPRQAA